MRIDPSVTLMLLVDVQEKLFAHIHNNQALCVRLEIVLKGLRILELPILCNQQYTDRLGETIAPVRALLASQSVYEKRSFSCCGNPDILKELNQTKTKNVILAGTETHICVLQTVLDLVANGYTPIVVADACGSREQSNHDIALRRMEKEGAIITTSESLLFELLQTSTHPHFKAISALVK